jgi:hypothetical protein
MLRHHLQPKEIAYASQALGSALARGRVPFIEIFLDALIQYPVRLENEIDRIPSGSLATGIRGDVVGRCLDLVARVGHRNGQSANPHDGQVDHVVAHVGNLVEGKGSTLHDLAHGLNLVVLPHIDVFHA